MVCSDCAYHLRLSYNFKEQCQRSEMQLRAAFSDPIEIAVGEIDKLILRTVSDEKPGIEPADTADESKNDTDFEDVPDASTDDAADYRKIENPSGYECNECRKVFKYEGSCRVHILKHREFKKCDVCSAEFKRNVRDVGTAVRDDFSFSFFQS